MAYNYTDGDGVSVLLVTEPDGATEPLSNLDNAIRQIKAYLNDPVAGPAATVEALSTPIKVSTSHSGSPAQDITQASGSVTVKFDTVDLDSGTDFNNATYLFLAPEAGFYLVIAQVTMDRFASAAPVDIIHQLDILVDGVSGARTKHYAYLEDDERVTLLLVRAFNLSATQALKVQYTVTTTAGTLTMRVVPDARETTFQVTRFALS